MRTVPALLIAVATGTLPLSATHAAEDVMIIYDASGSIWGQVQVSAQLKGHTTALWQSKNWGAVHVAV